MPKLLTLCAALLAVPAIADTYDAGERPLELVRAMADGPLKQQLLACEGQEITPTLFSIGHRGAPRGYPEHTYESYKAAAAMGAGALECDVTFTSDKALVCRHAQDDLHKTTDILDTALAARCNAGACSTADITEPEFLSLSGVSDKGRGTVVTLAQSIAMFRELGVAHMPELKAPSVAMPYDGMSQTDYAQRLIDAYVTEGVSAADVWPQSFNLGDVLYWIEAAPEFGKRAIWLDGSYRTDGWRAEDPATWAHSMEELHAMGLRYIAPPLWVLLSLEQGEIVPSAYARAAKEAGLEIISWTVERSGPLNTGGGWYFQSVTPAVTGDGVLYEVIDVLARDVGVVGVFSDWAGTTSYYANCMGLE